MSTEIIQMPARESAGIVAGEVHRFSAIEIRQRVNLVQEVMQGIMKKDTHYGTIPGTPKPTLYKPAPRSCASPSAWPRNTRSKTCLRRRWRATGSPA